MLVDAHAETAEVVMDIRAAVARVSRSRPASR
jgi:hypothetical protein